jgi:predicted esterase
VAHARLAVILIHGRGGSASNMLALADELGMEDVAFAAPQAAGNTWYPLPFLAPLAQNEPGISSAMRVLRGLIDDFARQGMSTDRVALTGFSQGACLALEFAARHAQKYAAVVGLSGGLIGPPGTPRNYSGSLDGTPVFLGCSDVDPHIPLDRVHESGRVFRQLGATVDERIYEQMGHTISPDEIRAVQLLLGRGGMNGRRT